jgi:hypothetical protein
MKLHNIWTTQTLDIYLEYELHAPTNTLLLVLTSQDLQTLARETIR